jgi:hypothetical protein
MSGTMTRPKGLKLAGEFSVIVVGVLTALAADSWMEMRDEAARVRAAIPLLIRDLEADSVRMSATARFVLPHDTVFATLMMTPPEADLPVDSVAGLVQRLWQGSGDFSPSRSIYESLLQTDGVRHIGHLELQAALAGYYQEGQADVSLWSDHYIEQVTRLIDLSGRHVVMTPSTLEEGLRVQRAIPKTLGTSWSDVRKDDEFMWQIGVMNTFEEVLGSKIAAAQEVNAGLRRDLQLLL